MAKLFPSFVAVCQTTWQLIYQLLYKNVNLINSNETFYKLHSKPENILGLSDL